MRTLLGMCLMAMSVGPVFAQGTVWFSNRSTFPNINAPVIDARTGSLLAGDAWLAQLYYAPGLDAPESSLRSVEGIVPFRTGGAAGYVRVDPDSGGGVRVLPDVGPGEEATLQIRAWNAEAGASYEAAAASPLGVVGKSNLVNLWVGSPEMPAPMAGLFGFSVVPVPEPSTLALSVLGVALLVLRRRKG